MLNFKNIFFLTLLSVFLLALSAQNVSACSCAVSGTVDKVFADVPNIVVLKVQSVKKLAEGEQGYGYGKIKQTVLTVERVFKGNLKVGQEMTFAQGGGADCVWTFDEKSVGDEYLFYLGEKPRDSKVFDGMISSTSSGNLSVSDGVWVASTCSRSGSTKYRAGDVKYLENISKVRGKTRLSGILSQFIAASTDEEESRSNSLANFKVKISGNGKNIELKTDENGFYEVYDLPAGKYTITPEKIVGYETAENNSITVDVKAKAHTEQNFYYRIKNRVSGKLFDANGKPLKDVCLHLIPARGKKPQFFYEGTCTDPDGSFELDEIPAGNYLLIINDDGEISADEPFGTFYYPSAVNRADASIIAVGAGDLIDNLIVNAPNTAETITISGVLLFENGKPAVDESVEFYSDESLAKQKDEEYKTADSRETADKDGRFAIRILKGQKGKLFGSTTTFDGEYENCPKLEKILRARDTEGNGIIDIETPSIDIETVSDLTGIELRFPFPSCKKADID